MVKNKLFTRRFYRDWVNAQGLVASEVIVGETNIFLCAEERVTQKAEKLVKKYRLLIKDYIKKHPAFMTALGPLEPDPGAPDIIKKMLDSSRSAGVGPMATVAGAIAEFVGRGLLLDTGQIILENGGDIFMKTEVERTVGIYAGDSPLSNRLFIKIKPQGTPLGICTSSGSIGHSLSFGKADACVIISKSASLADAVATATCNRVKNIDDITDALDFALSIKGVRAALIVYGKKFGASGDIELV